VNDRRPVSRVRQRDERVRHGALEQDLCAQMCDLERGIKQLAGEELRT